MVNVPLQGQNLLHIVFFLLLVLLQLERGTSDFLLGVLDLGEEVLVLNRNSLDCMLKPFHLKTRIPIVRQDVLFFNLKGPACLLGPPFLIYEFAILLFKKLVCMGALAELSVDEPVLAGECLYIFG